jgi:hypothetical protein
MKAYESVLLTHPLTKSHKDLLRTHQQHYWLYSSCPVPSRTHWERVRVRAVQYSRYLLHHSINIREHFVIPETKHSIAYLFEIAGPTLIRLHLLHVLATVEFDYQSNFNATEVRNKWTDRMLPTEFSAANLSVT